ncbi:hypothetical protein IHE44_0006117 [Lamprotornis superbus]|uniref:Tantalus-like domain-containing protein n=1 Tax=Lamprotornis superbus TaxID=245042 RepID=A0A835P3M2_9PASS|nr:hypothetical protein IHE44_0006117 [Lamprotornis superbus]
MAVPGPSLGLDAQSDQSDGPVPVLAHRGGPWTSAVGNFCQKTEDLGDMLQVISHGPGESFPEGLLQAGDLAEKEKSRKRHFRKLDCSSDGYQKEDEEAQAAEDHPAECCPSTLEESWSEQEDPHLNKQGAKSLRTCCTEIAGSLRNTEENQANVQVTTETLPKLTEAVQGSTRVDEVFLNSHSFGVDKIEENDNLKGESLSGYNSKEAIIFPEAHAPLAWGSPLCENDWGNRGIALHGINDIPTGKTMYCSAYTAEKSTATLARDEISNKDREVVEQFDLCKVMGSEIVCDRHEAKEQTGMCASQTDEFDKTRAVDSPNAPEGKQRNKTSEQLLVRYFNKNTCAHDFGFYNSLLGPWKRELGTCEQEEMPLLTAGPSECSTSTWDPHPALASVNVPTQHAGQTEETLFPKGNQFHPCQRECDVPVLASEQHSESLTNQPNTGLQTMGGSVGRDETDPNHSEEVLLKTGGDLPLLDHKFAREARFEGALQENIMGLDSLIGVKNEDSSGYMVSISDLIEEKTIRLQQLASKLLAPAKSSHNLEPLPYSSEILPVGNRYSQCRSKNLLEAFSCINRNVHSRWAGSWCTKMFSFQPLALYRAETTKIPSSDLSHKPPTSFLDTSVFPISLHVKLDSSPVTDLRGITSQHSVHHSPVFREMPAPASKWTFSFLLSQSCSDTTAFKEDSSVNNELRSSHSTSAPRTVAVNPDPGRNAVAGRRGGCSMLGLHTVLALSSSGCYRIWTRRRNLTSHIPTIQRLFISQLAQGLKGDRYPRCVSDDLVSSLPYSLGRVLSIWSQHGPSARPSETTPLHSNHCKWQPSVGFENSCAMLPHLPVQSMGALQTSGHAIRLETSFPVLLPKPRAVPESLPSPPRLSASELQIPALDEADASVPACLRSQDDTELKKTEAEKRPKKVSQIRIRKTIPKPDPNLTPMGLPKPKRLKKKEFSLEEIYTNKNYKSPPPARSLETIFEEPKEKNGHLISVSQQKRKRILEFQDFTLPRKRKTRGKIKAVGSFTRAKRAALQSAELDVLLSQKLMDLEAFFAEEVEQEQASSI